VKVTFPSISCRIPARLHSEAAGLDDHIIAWARHADLIRDGLATAHFHRAGFGRFAAAVYPRAGQLELVAEWQLFNWIVDDQLDEGHVTRTTAQRLHTAAELCAQLDPDLEAPAPAGPLAAALADLWERTAKPLSHAWRERFAAHYRDFLAFTILPHTEPARISVGGSPPIASSRPAIPVLLKRLPLRPVRRRQRQRAAHRGDGRGG
jgi:hypothetical protein